VASPEREPTTALDRDPTADLPLDRLSFVSLVALLERLTPEAARVGADGPLNAEGIRFRHDRSLIFSARDVAEVSSAQLPKDPSDPLSPLRRVYEVTTAFLGLTGSASPLPSYLPEEVAQEDPDHSVRRDFLDLFHHRLLSLLYRELMRFQLWAEQTKSLRDAWSSRLLALLGLDTYEQPLAVAIAPRDILRLAPVLARQSRTAVGLQLALETILGDRVEGGRIRVREFAGGWVTIDPPERTRLGVAKHELGREVVLGRRAYDRAGSFEIRVGPVSRRAYERFLPGGDLVAILHQIVSLFARDPLGYRVMVELAEGEAPNLRLASSGGNRLGRDSWLGLRRQRTWVRTYPVTTENKPEAIADPLGRA